MLKVDINFPGLPAEGDECYNLLFTVKDAFLVYFETLG